MFALAALTFAACGKDGDGDNADSSTLYTVFVDGGTASPARAVSGQVVTLTPSEDYGDYDFAGWTVIKGDVTIVDNKFTMPDEYVEIEAEVTFAGDGFERITDPAFLDYCRQFDTSDDGILSRTEWRAVVDMDVELLGINSLAGIEQFTSLRTLDCSENNLTELDMSGNTRLETLICTNNTIAELNVSKNTALMILNCANNNLVALDVNNNTALVGLTCVRNNLSVLDVSNNIALETMYCGRQKGTTLTLTIDEIQSGWWGMQAEESDNAGVVLAGAAE